MTGLAEISSILADKTTTADIAINIDVKVAWTVAGLAVLTAAGFAAIERKRTKQYRQLVGKHGELKKKYEELVDPGRTSSMITEDGVSRPEDLA